jgi:glycosyltransferase involved in cell wall biosynthesis
MKPSWICCQLGAREHYAVPRALHQSHQLAGLITDAWVPSSAPWQRLPLPSGLRDRHHPDLATASVQAFTPSLLRFELARKLHKTSDWNQMIARNQWFQAQTIQYLERARCFADTQGKMPHRPTLFTYSYAALEILRYAKSKGWRTILGQIDPGIVEEKIVIAEHIKYLDLAPQWQPVPPSYWDNWQAECQLADRILVNSTWSQQALQQAGIADDKIAVIPLAYTPPAATQTFQRTYPEQFSRDRPLRVLFLGQVILRKGIAALLEAAALLQDQPIEFWIVGSVGIERSHLSLPNLRWFDSVPRSETDRYYQQADVFLFPTLSDGFGLTQLEAQAWQLPIVASRFCGTVVTDGVNGHLLSEVSGRFISKILQKFVDNPESLRQLSQGATPEFDLSNLLQKLQMI